MPEKFKVGLESQKEIENQFAELGISSDMYPKCEDANKFGKRFKQCSILKEVPYRISDTSYPSTDDY